MEYMDYQEIMAARAGIQKSFDELMTIRPLVARPKANQWLFFRECAAKLLDLDMGQVKIFAQIPTVTAAQYKYEVEDRLRRFYRRPGKRQDFVFTLVHAKKLHWYGLDEDTYPVLAGYALLVRDMRDQKMMPASLVGPELAAYLEKVVSQGMLAEFNAYMALPEIDLAGLQPWFVENSPAMLEISEVVKGCGRRGWHLGNPMNPSTFRLLSVVVKSVSGDDAEVATREYWYLRWWDRRREKYTYPYRETNQQLYILNRNAAGEWKIFQNIRPAPRSSQPMRWNRRR